MSNLTTATVTKPGKKTLDNVLIEIGSIFDGGEEGYVRRAILDDKAVVLKEFKGFRDEDITVEENNSKVLHSYKALNELTNLGFDVIDDYGYVTLEDGKKYLLLKDLGKVCPGQEIVDRPKGIDVLPKKMLIKLEETKHYLKSIKSLLVFVMSIWFLLMKKMN